MFGGFTFGSVTFNLNVSPDGGGGTFRSFDGTFNVVFAAGTLYVKANPKAWETLGASKRTAELMGNNWVKEARTSPQYSFAQFVESAPLVGMITSGMGGFSELSGSVSVGGQHTLVLTDSEHDKIYIATLGTPYLLRVQGSGNGESGSVTFSGFGHTTSPKAPAHWISYPK